MVYKKDIEEVILEKEHLIKKEDENELNFGNVVVRAGKYKGRIGYYDDEGVKSGIVYFGDPVLCPIEHKIPLKYLSNNIGTKELLNRRKNINSILAEVKYNDVKLDSDYKESLFWELMHIDAMLDEIYWRVKDMEITKKTKVFISYSTKDFSDAKCIATDLKSQGYDVFFAEDSIKLGDNIFEKMDEGIKNATVLILIVSNNFMNSVYCKSEWTSFFAKISSQKECTIIPVLVEDVEVDGLLKPYKHCKFRCINDYENFMFQLFDKLNSIEKSLNS